MERSSIRLNMSCLNRETGLKEINLCNSCKKSKKILKIIMLVYQAQEATSHMTIVITKE
jgi:hypothetical protein